MDIVDVDSWKELISVAHRQ